MIRLRVTESGTTRTVEIRGDRAVFGRLEHCDVVLAGRGVSREHAELVKRGGAWTVRDLGSSNGTFLNDAPADSERVAPGDVIGIGPDVTIELLAEAAAPAATRAAAPRPARPDPMTTQDGQHGRARGAAPARAAAPARTKRGPHPLSHLEWRLAPEDPAAAVIVLHASATTVGRDAGAGIPIEDDSVSRMHARLDREGGALFVTDLKSRNGTRVNDAKVLREELHDGDTVVFGDAAYRVTRSERLAWERLALAGGALVVIAAVFFGVGRLSDSLGQQAALREAAQRVRAQALESTRSGIAASRNGEADLARTYFLHAADLLLLSDLAPPGVSLAQPQAFFRDIVRELPESERGFDFATALDPATVQATEARVSTLTNREYVAHQLRRYAAELGQDPHVPAGFEEQVWQYVTEFERHRRLMTTMLERARRIQPRLREILESRHLPEAFCYVTWVESALNPMARSPVGAVGLWQLMPATARELGLRVTPGNLETDERTDLEKSTRAGADYIAQLLRDQGPEYFMLVLASYNRGPGAVGRAKQRIQDPMLPATRKYWYLVEHNLLPEETRNYVPKILAVRVIAEAPGRFGFEAWQ